MTPNDSNRDRRQIGRRHRHQTGRVQRPGRSSLPCILKNISDGGALLVFERPVSLPFGFILTIDGEDQTRGCEVRHHYGERVGVEFVDIGLIRADAPSANTGETTSEIGPNSTAYWRR